MPIIYTYPTKTPASGDWILISDVSETNPKNATRKCTIQSVVDLITALVPGGGTVTSVATTNSLGVSSGITFAASPNPITTTGTITTSFAGTIGDILYADTATSLNKLTAGTLNHVLTSGGPGAAPSWAVNTDTTYSAMDTTTLGLGKLRYARGATPVAEALSVTASRTYGVTDNASNQLVVNVPWTDTDTTYSKATASALGLVKLEDVAVQTTAANAITTTALKTYGVQFNASDQLVVNVPWTGGGTITGFTPMDMYEATGETGTSGKRIFVQTVSPTTFTATKVKIFVHQLTGSPVFTVAIYAGTLKAVGGALLGQGSVSAAATGINVITLTPTNPGDLDLVAGADYVIAYNQTATNSSCVGSSTALSNAELATTIGTSGAFVDPLNAEGMAATGLRVAMTIW